MPSVLDVASYILEQKGKMTCMKLQKLVYYAQAWYVTWHEKPLFKADIEAWANGPVVPKLYKIHKGKFYISEVKGGNSKKLTELQKEHVKKIITFYGDKDHFWLSQLTHMEAPWKIARIGIAPTAPSKNKITLESMQDYYTSLL